MTRMIVLLFSEKIAKTLKKNHLSVSMILNGGHHEVPG